MPARPVILAAVRELFVNVAAPDQAHRTPSAWRFDSNIRIPFPHPGMRMLESKDRQQSPVPVGLLDLTFGLRDCGRRVANIKTAPLASR